jgi:acyl-CoA thioesterase FadM
MTVGLVVPRRLEAEYRVRFDEADATGHLRPSGFIRYAQDVAWRHSEEAGFGRDWYTARALHWLVRDLALRIGAPVSYGDTLAVSTEVSGWRHVWARRYSQMRCVRRSRGPADGEMVAACQTDWVLLGDDGQPTRVPPEIRGFLSPDRSFQRSRVELPETPPHATRLATRVRQLDVDPMGHMNNAAYVDLVDDAVSRLPAEGLGRSARARGLYRVGYVRPALPDSIIEASCWQMNDDAVGCRITDGAGAELTRVVVGRSGT